MYIRIVLSEATRLMFKLKTPSYVRNYFDSSGLWKTLPGQLNQKKCIAKNVHENSSLGVILKTFNPIQPVIPYLISSAERN
jgi:hypothetical protein